MRKIFGEWPLLMVAAMAMIAAELRAAAQNPPDLTQAVSVDRTLTYNLGATGLRGWIHTRAVNFFESQQGRTTTASRQIRCPADTMFGNEIRMGAFKALTKYHFREGMAAGVIFARTQGGHGSENRTGEIMKELIGYGAAAKAVLPGLRELIVEFNAQCRRGEFPAGELNDRRVNAVKEAIQAIEAATSQPELRTIGERPRR